MISSGNYVENRERNRSLDGLRAAATLLIIVYHLFSVSGLTLNYANGIGQFTGRLNVAVSIFFVLSGYLLFKPFVQSILLDAPLPRTQSFFLKRFVRIVPAYWLALLILWKIDAVTIPNASGFIRNFSLIHTLTVSNVFTGIGQTWTLSIEMMFYACLPFIAKFIGKRTKKKKRTRTLREIFTCLLALYISAYVFRVFLHKFQFELLKTHALWLPAHIDTFALGMCIATVVTALEVSPHLKARRSQLIRMAPVLYILSGVTWYWSTQLGLALAFETTPFRIELFGHFLYGVIAVTFVLPFCLDQGTSQIVKIFGARVCVWLGTISYGMYLWHFLFLDGHFANTYLPYRISDMDVATRLLVTIPGTIAIASASYYLVERPLIRALSQRMHKREIISRPI
jgi:peptidoglycan/LPS O-acetylase OafA/YrhL